MTVMLQCREGRDGRREEGGRFLPLPRKIFQVPGRRKWKKGESATFSPALFFISELQLLVTREPQNPEPCPY